MATITHIRAHLANAVRLGLLDIARQESQAAGVKLSLTLAIMSRETHCGALIERRGWVGDGGHGRGVMQVDDRAHPAFVRSTANNDHRANIRYALTRVLVPGLRAFGGDVKSALAAYNAGLSCVQQQVRLRLDVDRCTTGRDYGRDVLARAAMFASLGVDNASGSARDLLVAVLAVAVLGSYLLFSPI